MEQENKVNIEDFELLDYMNLYGLPERKEDMTTEQLIILDYINGIVCDFTDSIYNFYSNLAFYIFHQDEFSIQILSQYIVHTNDAYLDISSFLSCWFYNGSPLLKYIDIKSKFEEAYRRYNFDVISGRSYSLDSYKDLEFDNTFYPYELEKLMKKDARCDNARIYFRLEENTNE